MLMVTIVYAVTLSQSYDSERGEVELSAEVRFFAFGLE
jgi:hypothetical protein